MTLKKKKEKPGQLDESERARRREEKLLNSCCSFQSRLGPPEYRKWRRVHGLQRPLHPQQVMGWIVLFGLASVTFLVLIPALSTTFRESLLIILSTLFLLHVVSHLAALLLDPADPELRALKVKIAVPEFDRSKHAHVIENGRCHLCNIKTSGPRTKHCSVCNKCVERFDHHCKWLNHCVGGRNYIAFLVCVVSAVVASLVVVGVSVMELIYYHTDPSYLSLYSDISNSTMLQLPETVFVGVVSILMVLSATTAGLLLHLCLFHCYIAVLGITTYEYIRHYRQGTSLTSGDTHKCHFDSNENSRTKECCRSNRDENEQPREICYFSSRPPDSKNEPTSYRCFPKGSICFHEQQKTPVFRSTHSESDPEFLECPVKTERPFFVSFNDERKRETCDVHSHDQHRTTFCKQCLPRSEVIEKCDRCNSNDHSKSLKIKKRERKTFHFGKCWRICPKKASRNSPKPSESIKVKCNQIRPTTEDEINKALEKIAAMAKSEKSEEFNLRIDQNVVQTKSLPTLAPPQRRLKSLTDLKELENAFDLAEQPSLMVHHVRPTYRRSRKRNLIRRPLSPSLSPIRESGLSNPGSPRVDLISRSPDIIRAVSPPMSTIFLSNSPSPVSSEEDIVSKISVVSPKYSRSEDLLKTPQLPRKCYSPKSEQVFIVEPKYKSALWESADSKDQIG